VVVADVEPEDRIWLLPGFDEYMLGFKDRSLGLAEGHRPAIVPGGNGVFQPTVVRRGRVIGTWRRETGAGRTTVTVRPLVRTTARDRRAIEAAVTPYAEFLGHPVELSWASA